MPIAKLEIDYAHVGDLRSILTGLRQREAKERRKTLNLERVIAIASLADAIEQHIHDVTAARLLPRADSPRRNVLPEENVKCTECGARPMARCTSESGAKRRPHAIRVARYNGLLPTPRSGFFARPSPPIQYDADETPGPRAHSRSTTADNEPGQHAALSRRKP